MFVHRNEELAIMYITKREVNMVVESARLDLDPAGLDYENVVKNVFRNLEQNMESQDKLAVLMAVKEEFLLLADVMDFDVIWFESHQSARLGHKVTPLTTWFRTIEIYRLTCMNDRLGAIDLAGIKERAVAKVLRLQFQEWVRNNEIEVYTDNELDYSTESLIELSPGYFTPAKIPHITVEPSGDISPECKGFIVTNGKVLINGIHELGH